MKTNNSKTEAGNGSNQDFKVIALTGGPCGGKTSSISILSELMEGMGFRVYRVPETATILFGGGVSFPDLDTESSYSFQKSILKTMLAIEDTYRELASLNAQKGIKTVLLCDRGAMDPSAYMERQAWLRMLDELATIRDHRYDAVFHLVTCAKGAESFYQVENNATRTEGLELARKVDTALMHAWVGHQSLQVIDNVGSFTAKIDRLVQGCSTRLGLIHDQNRYGKLVKKHKFLIKNYHTRTPEEWAELVGESRSFLVEHFYLLNSSGDQTTQTRLRKRTETGSQVTTFTMTIRYAEIDGQRVEIRRGITPREYESYKNQFDSSRAPVVKIRRCFLANDRYFQLDVFQSPQSGLVLLEGYLDYENSKVGAAELVPKVFDIIDVSDNPEYSMYQLSKLENNQKSSLIDLK